MDIYKTESTTILNFKFASVKQATLRIIGNVKMINIGKGIMLFAALTIAGLLAIVGATTTALNQLRIGSDSYRLISDAKDLTADILPPPMYVIEAYLEAKLAAEQPSSIAQRRTKLSQLESDFRTRRDVWSKSALPGALRDGLTIRAANYADQFWQELNQRLLPAIETGNGAQGGGLAAAGRTEQAADVTGVEVQIEVLHHTLILVAASEVAQVQQ
jgi:hypothetical protein